MTKDDVKVKIPKELIEKILQLLEVSRNSGKIRKGTNETTKAVEKGIAQLVIIAEDVEPQEIVMHLPALCEEKKIPYVYVPHKLELGRSIGIDVGSASACIVDAGEGKKTLQEVVKSLEKHAVK